MAGRMKTQTSRNTKQRVTSNRRTRRTPVSAAKRNPIVGKPKRVISRSTVTGRKVTGRPVGRPVTVRKRTQQTQRNHRVRTARK